MIHAIFIPLFAGLALFLFGMKVMEIALHRLSGAYLARSLRRFTSSPWRGLLCGTGVTALLQSSSAITVITIGFVNAGILTFPQTLGIILGTNIGTCITTELIALQINHAALPILIAAFFVWILSWLVPGGAYRSPAAARRMNAIRWLAMAVCGFSCVLLGIEVMKSIVPALQSRGLFAWFVEQSQRSLFWGVVAGAAVTAVIHSSAAAIAMTMGLASVEAISVDLGIAIILGANVGTCVTAFIAGIGSSKYGQYVAWFHIMLNVFGTALFFPLIPLLREASALIGSSPSGQLAHAQTLFNIACSLLVLPLCYLPILNKKRT